jgi:nudix-type nucleoside diphosphatase (YffH/AdpP family)
MSIADHVRVHDVTILSSDWYILSKTRFSLLRSDGMWQEQTRETYDRGNGATILLYDRNKRTVILVRRFCFPAFVNGHDDLLIETPAGLLDTRDPAEAIRAEVSEETGYLISNVELVFEAFMSPGSVTEKLYFYIAEYAAANRVGQGGGHAEEGEDIEVLEVGIHDALQMIAGGEIRDGKTIMLLQYAALHIFR